MLAQASAMLAAIAHPRSTGGRLSSHRAGDCDPDKPDQRSRRRSRVGARLALRLGNRAARLVRAGSRATTALSNGGCPKPVYELRTTGSRWLSAGDGSAVGDADCQRRTVPYTPSQTRWCARSKACIKWRVAYKKIAGATNLSGLGRPDTAGNSVERLHTCAWNWNVYTMVERKPGDGGAAISMFLRRLGWFVHRRRKVGASRRVTKWLAASPARQVGNSAPLSLETRGWRPALIMSGFNPVSLPPRPCTRGQPMANAATSVRPPRRTEAAAAPRVRRLRMRRR